jgi:hypothetical protein
VTLLLEVITENGWQRNALEKYLAIAVVICELWTSAVAL